MLNSELQYGDKVRKKNGETGVIKATRKEDNALVEVLVKFDNHFSWLPPSTLTFIEPPVAAQPAVV